MRSDRRDIEDLLPQYLAGNLATEDRQAVAAACAESPELASELEELRDLKDAYRVLDQALPTPAPDLFQRVQQTAARDPRPLPTPVTEPGLGARIGEWMQGLFRNPALGWGAAALQLALLAWLVAAPAPEPGYQTLSAPVPAASQGVRLNVVFRPEISARQLQQVLTELDCEIVGGPSVKGLYVLRLGSGAEAADAIARLQESGLTRFVAEAY